MIPPEGKERDESSRNSTPTRKPPWSQQFLFKDEPKSFAAGDSNPALEWGSRPSSLFERDLPLSLLGEGKPVLGQEGRGEDDPAAVTFEAVEHVRAKVPKAKPGPVESLDDFPVRAGKLRRREGATFPWAPARAAPKQHFHEPLRVGLREL